MGTIITIHRWRCIGHILPKNKKQNNTQSTRTVLHWTPEDEEREEKNMMEKDS
jgi:hypothetical protein